MKFTFRYLMYTLVLIGFVAFTTTLCSKALMSPILEKEPLQESIIYQKTHEARIKANVERFLEKMLGKKLFVERQYGQWLFFIFLNDKSKQL